MLIISSLKSNQTRERKALLKEESEAQKILQTQHSSDPTEAGCLFMSIGKSLLNLETKLSRLEIANEKLADAYDHNEDPVPAEQFQAVLDKDSELTDGIIDKISQLKILKEELKRKRREHEGRESQNLEQRMEQMQEQVRQLQSTHQPTGMANIWSQPAPGPLKPPQLDITSFSGDVLKWKEFWDAFGASVHKANYTPVDKLLNKM